MNHTLSALLCGTKNFRAIGAFFRCMQLLRKNLFAIA
nr:MAG TPA: hypothetical protein [Caudoviricetes sp.]